MTPLVSVLAVTYNHEKFIGECMDSVLSQTYPHIELVIADDGSADGAPDIIRRYASQDSRVKPVLAENNGGLAANFNRAIGCCRGEFIAIIAGDDLMLPGKIQAQVRFFMDHDDCGAVSHDSLVVDEQGRYLYQWSQRHQPLVGGVESQFKTNWLLQKDCRPAPPSLMFRRIFLEGVQYDPHLRACNEWFHPIQCSMNKPNLKWCYIPEVLSKYRKSELQMSRDLEVDKIYYEERMLVLSIASSRYPQISFLIHSCRAYTQFQFLVFDWHPRALRDHYERQFLKEAGFFRWLYMRSVYFLLRHPILMNHTRFLRKLIIHIHEEIAKGSRISERLA